MSTVSSWLRDLVAVQPHAEALVDPDGPRIVSFAELDARVSTLAGGLRGAGLRRGDRLASFVPNGLLAVELFLAAAKIGAVTIGVNTRYRVSDLRHVLEQGRPRILVSARDFLGIDFPAVVEPAIEGLTDPPEVLWPDDVDQLRNASPMVQDGADPGDLLVAFTTSGTTGRPKLAAHDHATTVAHLRAVARSLDVGPASTALAALPFCGTFGFVSLLAVLLGAGRVVVPPRFEPSAAAALIERYRVTHLNGSDDMLLAVLDQGGDLSSWQHGVHAEFTGRGLASVRAAEKVGAHITGVYGSSETFALLARWPTREVAALRGRNGGVLVDAAMEVRALDTQTGQPVPYGTAGELQFRGPSVLSAYLQADGTAPPKLVDGAWMSTGDLGVVESGRAFVYLARLGDALRLAGFLTDPAEIEQHLLTHPAVTGAHVVGAPSRDGAEVAVGFVTITGWVEEGDLIRHCRSGLANYKVPARVVIVDEFPVVDGANGVKIRKTDLRARAADLSL